MDMAVGIILGAAFTAIVKSMVGDLINPLTGLFLGGVDLVNLLVVLQGEGDFVSLAAAREAGVAMFAYGAFIMAVINFLIIAWVVFLLVRYVNKLKEAHSQAEEIGPDAAPSGPSKLDILTDIRTALRQEI